MKLHITNITLLILVSHICLSQDTVDSIYINDNCYQLKMPKYFDTKTIVFTSVNTENIGFEIDKHRYSPSVADIASAESVLHYSVRTFYGSHERRKSIVLNAIKRSYRQYYGAIDNDHQRFIFINLIDYQIDDEYLQRYYQSKLIASLNYKISHHNFLLINITKKELVETAGSLYGTCENLYSISEGK